LVDPKLKSERKAFEDVSSLTLIRSVTRLPEELIAEAQRVHERVR